MGQHSRRNPLKAAGIRADEGTVRVSRLSIDTDRASFVLELHRELTIVTGLNAFQREALTTELVDALGSHRTGVNVEIEDDQRRRMLVARAPNQPARVIDLETSGDMSRGFTTEGGELDVLGIVGDRSAGEVMTFRGSNLAARTRADAYAAQLASCDQNLLWQLAEDVRIAEMRLDGVAGSDAAERAEGADVEEIDRCHAEVEAAVETLGQRRRLALWTGLLSAVFSLVLMLTTGSISASVPLIMVTVITTMFALTEWRRTEKLREQEREMLSTSGARSYLGIHLDRVNNLLADSDYRQQLMQTSGEHRAALKNWHRIAGDVPADWALKNEASIREFSELRHELSIRAGTPGEHEPASEDDTRVLKALLDHLRAARTAGRDSSSVPAILDEPLAAVSEAAKPVLLETIMRAARRQQVLVLSQDPGVEEWARLESMTGHLSLLRQAAQPEPRPEPTPSETPPLTN